MKGGRFESESLTLDDYQSADAPMRSCLERARVACKTELPILVLGESGTGKTLLARAIHNSSRRRDGPFVSFNAAALSETLLDSQLFGHEAGAFTGAQRQVKGRFERAHGGTLFLDEVGDLSALAQAKILRAVEYGEFERLGSERLHVADVRLVSATHDRIDTFTADDRFRRDLFYRISGFTLTVPPLRERPNDLRALVASAIGRAAAREGRTITSLSRAAADLLFTYPWPGNLRELERVVGAAVALARGSVIEEDSVLLPAAPSAVRAAEPAPAGDLTLAAAERRHVRSVLAALSGNKTRAARALGISRSRLDRKLREASK